LPFVRRTPVSSSSTTICVVGLSHTQSVAVALNVALAVVSQDMHVVRSQLATLDTVAQLMHVPYGELGSAPPGSTDVRIVFPVHSQSRPSAETTSPEGQVTHDRVCARKNVPLTVHTSGACETPNDLQSPST
jgi:hypothetical protein